MNDRQLLRRYLLGRVSEDERQRLETEYVANPDTFEDLTEVENDLIDSYARRRLPDAEKRDFEMRYMFSPEKRARVDFARVLAEVSQTATKSETHKSSLWWRLPAFKLRESLWMGFGLAACAAAVMVAIVTLPAIHHTSPDVSSQQPPTKPTGGAPSHSADASSPASQGAGVAPGAVVAQAAKPDLSEFTVKLNPGVERGEGTQAQVVVVPSAVTSILLKLGLDEDDRYQAYTVVLQTPEGRVLRTVTGLKSELVAGNRTVTLRLQSRLLPRGEYVVDLKGATGAKVPGEAIESYSFRVEHK